MAGTYLLRTLTSTGNRKLWTWSAWIKKSLPDGADLGVFGLYEDGSNYFRIRYRSNQKLQVDNVEGSTTMNLILSEQHRDISGWYHLVVRYDSAQSTASNRVKIYVNGVQVTSFDTATYPSQNANTYFPVNALPLNVGRTTNNQYFDGSMSHIHFTDGYAYDASTFGSTDSTTGEWKINTSPSVTYGTNGFFILKDGNTITDSSPNSNNFSLGGGTLTKTEDCPSNVFATLNPLIINNFILPNMTYVATSEGNNTLTGTASTNNGNCYATLGASSGKFYCEIKKIDSGSGYPYLGIMPEEGLNPTSSSVYGLPGYHFPDTVSYEPSGNKRINGSTSSYGATYAANDIIGIAMDLDNGAVYFSKNGVFQNSGNPASGASKTGAALTFTANNKNYFFGGSTFNTGGQIKFNFGNGYFGTTAVSSAGSNASGIGIFEYDVPTGYTALSTKGLNL